MELCMIKFYVRLEAQKYLEIVMLCRFATMIIKTSFQSSLWCQVFFLNKWPCRIFCRCYFAIFFFLKGWYWLLNCLDSYFKPYLSLQVAKLSISPMSIVIDSGPIRLFLYDVLKSMVNNQRAMQNLECTLISFCFAFLVLLITYIY